MPEFSYLVAIALIEQGSQRMMPLGGKSINQEFNSDTDLLNFSQKIVLELLLRVMQKSQNGAIQVSIEDRSILLVEIPMEVMQNKLPILKSEWLETGKSEVFFSEMQKISKRIWTLSFVRYEGLKLNSL